MSLHTSRLHDRLDTCLWHLLCEVRLAGSLVDPETHRALHINAGDLAAMLDQITQQLQAARSIARRLTDATRQDNG